MISLVPIPRLSDLLQIFIPSAISETDISLPWSPDPDKAIWFSRATASLETVVRWYLNQEDQRHGSLWVPDYICNDLLQPLRSLDIEIFFYPINADLEPDWENCDDLARRSKPGLFVLVHFFGRPADTSNAIRFCSQYGAQLIEDATHALRPCQGIGEAGDFVIFSPYKHLPISDGGLLIFSDEGLRPALKTIADTRKSAGPSWRWFARKLAYIFLPDVLLKRIFLARLRPFDQDPPPQEVKYGQMSRLAATLTARYISSLPAIAARRRKFFNILCEFEWPPQFKPLMKLIDDETSPYRFVLDCAEHSHARQFYLDLNEAGCPAETWPDLPLEISGQLNEHRMANELRKRLLFIPVHQSIELAALIEACGLAARQFNERLASRQ